MILPQIKDQHDYGYEVPPCSRKQLIDHAHSIHKAVGYKGETAFPILELIEFVFPAVYDDFDFVILPEPEMGDDFGLTLPDEHVIKLREDVYEAAEAGQGFGRMVAAHESSHLLRHEKIPVSLARRKATKEIPSYRSSEWQANAMAGALLMPASKIVDMTVQEIIERYKVTPTAAETQLRKVREGARKWPIPKL